jgi:hypothetical protein
MDNWTTNESGGLPVNNTQSEFDAWGKNPQYYLKVTKATNIYISLLQPDGRMTKQKFPYPGVTQKASIIISKAQGKRRIKSFVDTEHIYISPVRQHRENSVFQQLMPGEYIISCCPLKAGSTGIFCLEINVEDSFKDDNYTETDFLAKMTNCFMERLDNPKIFCKLKIETSVEEIKELNEKKKIFMYQQFKNMLIRNDTLTSTGNAEKQKKKKRQEEEYF